MKTKTFALLTQARVSIGGSLILSLLHIPPRLRSVYFLFNLLQPPPAPIVVPPNNPLHLESRLSAWLDSSARACSPTHPSVKAVLVANFLIRHILCKNVQERISLSKQPLLPRLIQPSWRFSFLPRSIVIVPLGSLCSSVCLSHIPRTSLYFRLLLKSTFLLLS